MPENLLMVIVQCFFALAFFIWLMRMTRPARWPHVALYGKSNSRKERKWLLEELKRAQGNFLFVVGRGCFEFWKDKKVIRKMCRAAGRGVKIELIVGESHFEALQKLVKERIIKLHALLEEPQNTRWLIDDIYGAGTYTSNSNKGYYLWTRGHDEITQEQRVYIGDCLKDCVVSQ